MMKFDNHNYTFEHLPFHHNWRMEMYVGYEQKLDKFLILPMSLHPIDSSLVCCKLFVSNSVIGDVNTLRVGSGFMSEEDDLFTDLIYPLFNDFSTTNLIEIQYDLY